MAKWLRPVLAGVMLACIAPSSPAADPNAPPADDLIHSDLPLLGSAYADLWPRGFSDMAEGIFGCESRFRAGDWRFDPADARDDPRWHRVEVGGAIHCRAYFNEAEDRDGLASAEPRSAFLVRMGSTRIAGKAVELWTIQLGARPGSDYILLLHDAADKETTRFAVLQRACPRGAVRRGQDLEILRTDYCAINSPHALMRLARSMARRPLLGTLTRLGPATENGQEP